MKKETKRRLKEIGEQHEVDNVESTLNRARSITVGTSFGGTTEVMMRTNNGSVVWCILQPVEVIELIHQLAANVGCHIAIKPRDDFSSWRDWRVSEAEKKHLNGWAPFVNDMAVFQRLGLTGFDQEAAERIMNEHAAQKEYEYVNGQARKKEVKNDSTVATKKAVNRRTAKRTAKTP